MAATTTTTTSTTAALTAQPLTGCVKWFNNGLNYGFITVLTDGEHRNTDVFVHQSNIRTARDCFRTLYTGECVQFELAKSDNEKHPFHAVNVHGFNSVSLRCEVPRGAGFRGNSAGGRGGRGGYGSRGGRGGGFRRNGGNRQQSENAVSATQENTAAGSAPAPAAPALTPETSTETETVSTRQDVEASASGAKGRGRGRGRKVNA